MSRREEWEPTRSEAYLIYTRSAEARPKMWPWECKARSPEQQCRPNQASCLTETGDNKPERIIGNIEG